MNSRSVVVVGGGPGGYEAALVAAHLGAQVTVVEREGLGGAAVLTDVVPSKSLIATADFLQRYSGADRLGLTSPQHDAPVLADVNARILDLARAQTADIAQRLASCNIEVVSGSGRMLSSRRVLATTSDGHSRELEADTVLIAVGASPRQLPTATPDGERILTWKQLYSLTELPERLIVVGSGVTGAEFAQAYLGLGSEVVLVSSRDRVLPGEDADAANVLEDVFRRRGMQVLDRSRASAARVEGDAVVVSLEDGREIRGSHVLIAVGAIPNTADLGLDEVGIRTSESGHVVVDRVSRTSVPGVYAAGDCTGVYPLASVAAMQGRIAMAHALGDAVAPLNLPGVCANIFTDPEIATVGVTHVEEVPGARMVMLPLASNPRAKMLGVTDGFVKLFAAAGGALLGGVVVAPMASELIFPVALAVQNRLTVDQFAATFTVYPSLSGSVAEVARMLHATDV